MMYIPKKKAEEIHRAAHRRMKLGDTVTITYGPHPKISLRTGRTVYVMRGSTAGDLLEAIPDNVHHDDFLLWFLGGKYAA